MATWRRKALELFPDLRTTVESPETSVMLLFFDLCGEVRRAHRDNDEPRLRAIYTFAEWCAHQPRKELWNAAALGFYEHVFDEPSLREKVAPWLPDDLRSEYESLWAFMLEPSEFAEVKRILKRTPPIAPQVTLRDAD
jgi:hypothetical protein